MASVAVGEQVPDVSVYRAVREAVSLSELVADGPAVFHFYVLDFTGGPEGGWELQLVRFGRAAEELDRLGVRVFALSHDSPASHAASAKQLAERDLLGSQELLSDWNSEASRAFGVHRDELIGLRPLNVRGAFLVDRDRTLRYAWASEDLRELPDTDPVLAAARAL